MSSKKGIKAKEDWFPWFGKGTIIPPSEKGAKKNLWYCIDDGKINPEHKGHYCVFKLGLGFLTLPPHKFDKVTITKEK